MTDPLRDGDVPTPYLRVDEARLEANLAATATRAAAAGVALRPHAKTHKSVEIARRQLDAGAVGLTVATLGEAEVFAAAGIEDLFIAYPLHLDRAAALRLRALSELARVAIGVESIEGARLIPAGTPVLVEVDSGHHRTGVVPRDAGRIASAAAEVGADVLGVFTFPGHGYALPREKRTSASFQEAASLDEAAASLRAVGLEPRVISGGSTPTLRAAMSGAAPTVVTELRPGVYALGDAQQWELGSMAPDEIALTCRATVVSTRPGRPKRAVLDAGSKALGADRAAYATGFGRLLDDPDARIVGLSEHHAVVETTLNLGLGDRVDVVPNHVCNAINLADLLWIEGESGLRASPVDARGRNS